MQIANRYRKLVSYLPYDTQVQWLRGDGASGLWIPCNLAKAKLIVSGYRTSLYSQSFMLSQYYDSSGNTDVNISWSRNSNTRSRGSIITQAMSNQNTSATYSNWFSSSAQLTTKLTMTLDILNHTNTYWNGGGGSWPAKSSYQHIGGIGLLCKAMQNNTANSYSTVKISYCKIYVNEILTYDFVPVRKAGVGYFYEKVAGELWGIGAKGGRGSGNFILGPDV